MNQWRLTDTRALSATGGASRRFLCWKSQIGVRLFDYRTWSTAFWIGYWRARWKYFHATDVPGKTERAINSAHELTHLPIETHTWWKEHRAKRAFGKIWGNIFLLRQRFAACASWCRNRSQSQLQPKRSIVTVPVSCLVKTRQNIIREKIYLERYSVSLHVIELISKGIFTGFSTRFKIGSFGLERWSVCPDKAYEWLN